MCQLGETLIQDLNYASYLGSTFTYLLFLAFKISFKKTQQTNNRNSGETTCFNKIMQMFRIQTHLDLLLVCYIRECPWVNLNFVWVVGAVQVPVGLRQLAFMIPDGVWRRRTLFTPTRKNKTPQQKKKPHTQVQDMTMKNKQLNWYRKRLLSKGKANHLPLKLSSY